MNSSKYSNNYINIISALKSGYKINIKLHFQGLREVQNGADPILNLHMETNQLTLLFITRIVITLTVLNMTRNLKNCHYIVVSSLSGSTTPPLS